MAIVCEFLGIAALGSGSVPANDPKKADVGRDAGERLIHAGSSQFVFIGTIEMEARRAG